MHTSSTAFLHWQDIYFNSTVGLSIAPNSSVKESDDDCAMTSRPPVQPDCGGAFPLWPLLGSAFGVPNGNAPGRCAAERERRCTAPCRRGRCSVLDRSCAGPARAAAGGSPATPPPCRNP